MMAISDLFLRFFGVRRDQSTDSESRNKELEKFVLQARKSIRVVTGEGQVYLEKAVLDTIVKLTSEAAGSVEFVVGPRVPKKDVESLFASGADVYALRNEPFQHIAIIDEKSVRIEEPHAVGAQIRAQYFVKRPSSASELLSIFEKHKQNADKLNGAGIKV